MTTNSQVFTGTIEIERLNIGGSSSYEVPKIDTQLVLNGDFSFPTLDNDYLVTVNLSNWKIGGHDKFITLYKDITLSNGITQYLGLSYLNGSLSQDLVINTPGNYNITLYLKNSLGNSSINLTINNNILNETIDLSNINDWTQFSYDFNILVPGTYTFSIQNTVLNSICFINGITLFTYISNNNSNNVLDISGNIYVDGGFIVNNSDISSSMIIISDILDITSNVYLSNNLNIKQFNTSGIVHNNALGTLYTSLITNSDISDYANISDSKLSNITSVGKVANSATTASIIANSNTIALRDENGKLYGITPDSSSNDSTLATTEFVNLKISELEANLSPENLNTILELANGLIGTITKDQFDASINNLITNDLFNTFLSNNSIDINKLRNTDINLQNQINRLSNNTDLSFSELRADLDFNVSTLVSHIDASDSSLRSDMESAASTLRSEMEIADTSILVAANSYSDASISSLKNELDIDINFIENLAYDLSSNIPIYINNQDDSVLAAANSYTDASVTSLSTALTTLISTKANGILFETKLPESLGVPGQIAIDTSYMYICVGQNAWKRIAFGEWP